MRRKTPSASSPSVTARPEESPAPRSSASLIPLTGIKDPAARAAQALTHEVTRAVEDRYLLEGEEMIEQALAAGVPLDAAFLANAPGHSVSVALAKQLAERGTPAYSLSQGLLFKILGAGYETSLTALAVARRTPCEKSDLPPASAGRMIVVGERLQDPRNVGVMVRTTEAVGAAALLLCAECPDPTSRAAVRSSTGSILRTPVLQLDDLPAILERLRTDGYRLVATSAAAPQPLWDADLTGPACFLFGNETEGLSAALRETADEYVSIPLYGGAHSLNVTVAAGITLYEAARQRRSAPKAPA